MAQDFATQFYKSKERKRVREAYGQSKKWLCEDCLCRGIITPADTVHHIIPLTIHNITNSSIALDFKNLKLLCRRCHALEHSNKNKNKRYSVSADGKISPLSE